MWRTCKISGILSVSSKEINPLSFSPFCRVKLGVEKNKEHPIVDKSRNRNSPNACVDVNRHFVVSLKKNRDARRAVFLWSSVGVCKSHSPLGEKPMMVL